MTTHTLSLPDVDLVYDVLGPSEGRPLVMIGQPMTAEGFHALAEQLPERRVVLYDPRGLGRSVRSDGVDTSVPEVQAEDLHALVTSLGDIPVDVLASSGGAITALAWVAAYPDDIATLVAHEPPLLGELPDAEAAARGYDGFRKAYADRGWGAGMAAFIAYTSWSGEYTEDYFAQPAPDPAMFGMPTEDDGSRDDPLLSDRSLAIVRYRPDAAALQAAATRVLLAVGEETGDAFTGRTTRALAERLGQDVVVFPGGHGGFGAEDGPWPGQAKAFAVRLREVLDS
ncbi:alpha/beta fold hydrolase [Actinomycetospora termitidis]|uniref:Alpha/beta hydrolase n=1 Tax=Actinomycetospora termitidis TaxID=3053470 RepID=A0ABT7M8W4_9PSEU|nr:alpha/beta hydrolase [Actinomycetospora sp. Odt1-22]MDL5157120.1 alpha/beta hydrolase [Actinomycetospora sp. Odt1-22]